MGEAAGTTPDSYQDRLLKYIPAEVVTLYAAASKGVAGLDSFSASGKRGFALFSFVFCMVASAVVTHLQTRKVSKPPATGQIVIATAAFAVWALALGVPQIDQIAGFRWWWHDVWQFALPFFTFSVALYVPKNT